LNRREHAVVPNLPLELMKTAVPPEEVAPNIWPIKQLLLSFVPKEPIQITFTDGNFCTGVGAGYDLISDALPFGRLWPASQDRARIVFDRRMTNDAAACHRRILQHVYDISGLP
jgi:hypothetical protein